MPHQVHAGVQLLSIETRFMLRLRERDQASGAINVAGLISTCANTVRRDERICHTTQSLMQAAVSSWRMTVSRLLHQKSLVA